MRESPWIDYDFAVIRAVPRVHLEAFVNVGVVVHARTEEFIDVRIASDPKVLEQLVPDADHELLARYLDSYARVARGEDSQGPIALAPPSERFHWLTAPRSDVVQCSQVHGGRTRDITATVGELFAEYVRLPGAG
ncbi:MAG: DUF3037 domain-containing protein [Longimicrobiales bacterium]